MTPRCGLTCNFEEVLLWRVQREGSLVQPVSSASEFRERREYLRKDSEPTGTGPAHGVYTRI